MSIHSISALQPLKGHTGAVYALCEGLEARSLLSAGSDGFLCKWSPLESAHGKIIADTGERIFCISVFKQRNTIFAGTMKGDLFQMNLENQIAVRRFRFHDSSIYRLAVWNDLLIAASSDGIISIWNQSGEIINHLKISPHKLRSICIDENKNYLYCGDGEGNLWKLHLPDLEITQSKMKLHARTIFSMVFIPENNLILTGGLDAHLKILDPEFNILQEIKAHWFCINDICNLIGTTFFATASRDKSIRIWDKRNWSLVKEISIPKFAAHLHSVNCLYWNKDESILYSGGDDGMILGWKIEFESSQRTINITHDS